MERAILLNLPHTIRGFVKTTCEPDGVYQTVIINARLDFESQRAVYRHEKRHIESGDCESWIDADAIEAERHEE